MYVGFHASFPFYLVSFLIIITLSVYHTYYILHVSSLLYQVNILAKHLTNQCSVLCGLFSAWLLWKDVVCII